MSKIAKKYDVCAGKPYETNGEQKKFWINCGRAIEWDDGGISIELHAMPTGNWFDGKLSLFEQKERDETGRTGTSRGKSAPSKCQASSPADEDDSTIPF